MPRNDQFSRMDDITILRCSLDETPQPMRSVLDYWRDLKGNRVAPTWKELDLAKLPAPLLPTTIVYDVIDDGGVFRARYYGSGLTQVHGVDLTGQTLGDFPWRPFADFLGRELRHLVETRQPEHLIYTYRKPEKTTELQTVLRLPLSDDGRHVTHIVSLIEFTLGIRATRDFITDLAHN